MSMDYHPFDPDSGLIPEIADFGPLIERSGGAGIVLIAVPDVETTYWCAKAAAALVAAWSAQGSRILLADVSLTHPVLHEVFDLSNSEGVTDVMVQGAQLRAVCREIGSSNFLFMSAGTMTVDAAAVMRSKRWDIVINALGEAGVTLVMYAPADLPGLDALLSRGSAVLLLGGDLKGAEEATQTLGLSEAPQVGPSAPSCRTVRTEAAGADEVRQAGAAADVPRWDEPGARAVDQKRSYLRRVPAWKPAAAGLLILAVWAGSRVLLGGAAESSGGPEGRVEPPVPVIAPAPTPAATPPQAYSISLAAFQDGELAALQAERLAGRRADLLFITVPVMVSGRIFHRILAGPATDSGAAEVLRASLAETLPDEDSASWIVRATPLAFTLGEYESRAAADRRAEELSVAWLAPYVLEVGAPDLATFHVFAGAFADSAEASAVHARFRELGEEPLELVRRAGRYVAGP